MKKISLIVCIATVLLFSTISNSQAADNYTYDDDGRLSEILWHNDYNGDTSKIILTYDTNGKISGGTLFRERSGGYDNEGTYGVTDNGDGTYFFASNNTRAMYYAAVIDSKGRIIQDGVNAGPDYDNLWRRNLATYAYDEQTGQRISRTEYNCEYIAGPSQCTQSSIQNYSYEYDEDGNIIAEKINGEVVATRTYSPVYLAKLKAAQTCPAGTFSVGGECLPKRYTPAELAEIVGESNTILLYYK